MKTDLTSLGSESAMRIDRPAKTLRELALDKMREAITGLRFKPGDRLVERDLCDQLGVSRSIVREVLRHLESEGLVSNIPNKGPMVAQMSGAEAKQIYEIRGALEGMAAELCAKHADSAAIKDLEKTLADIRACYARQDFAGVLTGITAFYQKLFWAVDRQVAWGIVSTLTVRINQLRSFTIKTKNRDTQGQEQMARILEAIRQRDAEGARNAAVQHVAYAADLTDEILSLAPMPTAMEAAR